MTNLLLFEQFNNGLLILENTRRGAPVQDLRYLLSLGLISDFAFLDLLSDSDLLEYAFPVQDNINAIEQIIAKHTDTPNIISAIQYKEKVLQLKKMKRSSGLTTVYQLKISDNKIRVFPHIEYRRWKLSDKIDSYADPSQLWIDTHIIDPESVDGLKIFIEIGIQSACFKYYYAR